MCNVPNEEIQIDFGGPINNEKNQEVYFLACIDRCSKFLTAEVFVRANADDILKFLQEYVLLQRIPRSIRLHQARFQTGNRIKAFCNQNNLQLIEAPIHDHRPVGLVESLIQTIKNRLACIKRRREINLILKHQLTLLFINYLSVAKRLLISRRFKQFLVDKRILHLAIFQLNLIQVVSHIK